MSVIFTEEYLATAPHADVVITYPDGATYVTRALSDGNGSLVASIRCAILFDRGSWVAECSRNLDRLRKSHADAFAKNPARASSAWAVAQ